MGKGEGVGKKGKDEMLPVQLIFNCMEFAYDEGKQSNVKQSNVSNSMCISSAFIVILV